jgi:hypothetical protein
VGDGQLQAELLTDLAGQLQDQVRQG